MIAETAKDRVKQRFDRWDSAGNGALTHSDMEQEAIDIAAAFGKEASSIEAHNIKNAFRGLFDFVADQAGVTPDGQITAQQFQQVAENLIFEHGEAAFNRALRPLVNGIIDLCDRSDDGIINREEFTMWVSVLGLDPTAGAHAFDKIDRDGNGELTREELLGVFRDYHFGRLDVELIAV